ncbi:hypothetical protein BGZ98_000053, partial [Dissophora globulifera]
NPTKADLISNYNQIRKKKACTNCSLAGADQSNYWFPSLYYHNKNGTYSLVKSQGLTVYYLMRDGPNEKVPKFTAFPPGFRMVAGNPAWANKKFKNTIPEQAVSYVCMDYSTGGPNIPEGPYFPFDKYSCTSGFRAQVFFPMCGDGRLDSPDHKSHVAYPIQNYNGGDCPKSHPIKYPGVFYEAFYSVPEEIYPQGKGENRFTWSHGDTNGRGFHGDFVSGWDPKVMTNAINDPTCRMKENGFGNDLTHCNALKKYLQDGERNVCAAKGLAKPLPKAITDLDIGLKKPIKKLSVKA